MAIRKSCRLLRSIILCAVAACGNGSTDEDCKNDCESRDWPRLIVGVVGPAAGDVEGVEVEYANGMRRPAGSALCPSGDLPASLTCTYTAIGGGPITVIVSLSGREPVSQMTELADFNYCGRDIAYVEIDVTEQETAFHETRYVSPCDPESLEQ